MRQPERRTTHTHTHTHGQTGGEQQHEERCQQDSSPIHAQPGLLLAPRARGSDRDARGDSDWCISSRPFRNTTPPPSLLSSTSVTVMMCSTGIISQEDVMISPRAAEELYRFLLYSLALNVDALKWQTVLFC